MDCVSCLGTGENSAPLSVILLVVKSERNVEEERKRAGLRKRNSLLSSRLHWLERFNQSGYWHHDPWASHTFAKCVKETADFCPEVVFPNRARERKGFVELSATFASTHASEASPWNYISLGFSANPQLELFLLNHSRIGKETLPSQFHIAIITGTQNRCTYRFSWPLRLQGTFCMRGCWLISENNFVPDVNSDYRDDTTANVQEFVPKPETLHPTFCRVGNVTNVTSGLFCGMHACAVLSDHVCNVCVFLCLFVCLFWGSAVRKGLFNLVMSTSLPLQVTAWQSGLIDSTTVAKTVGTMGPSPSPQFKVKTSSYQWPNGETPQLCIFLQHD